MGKYYEDIDDKIRAWLTEQKVFFVATAPRSDEARINCSPKGLDALRVLGPHQLAYGDTGGSGIETVAHLKENARITIMVCALEGAPKIFRFYGRGRVVEPHHEDFERLELLFPALPMLRNVILIDVDSIRDACGYGVPQYEYLGERDTLGKWRDKKSDAELEAYRREKNSLSLDGLPGLDLELVES